MSPFDIRDLDRRAVLDSVRLVDLVEPADLDRPSTCEGWSLGDLLAHMTVQHRGFASAARGGGMELDGWQPKRASEVDDPVADYRDAVDDVLDAFAADDVLERRFALPELTTEATFPAERAIGFHLVDYVVHSWDVARTLGRDYRPDDDVAAVALGISRAVPNGPERLNEGAAFRPGRDLGGSVPVIDRIVALLGRSPDWPNAMPS